jgi:hypothetical protein
MVSLLAGPLARLKLYRQERRWWHKSTMMFEQSDVLVVTHTKCGSTWLRALLSHICHLRFGVPADELIHFDNLHRLAPAIPRLHFVRDTEHPGSRGGARDVAIAPHQKMIVLVRDPRDTAISFYFHVRNRASARELIHKEIPESARAMALADFVAHPRYGVPRIIGCYNKWLAAAAAQPQRIFLRYEDLRRRPQEEIRRLLSFLEIEASDEQIAAAIAFASFDSLQQKEASGFFRSDRFGATDHSNPDSRKVRSGRIGGYRGHVSEAQARQLDDMVETALDPRFGYDRDGCKDIAVVTYDETLRRAVPAAAAEAEPVSALPVGVAAAQ